LELLDSVVASAGKQITTNSGGKRATSNKREKLSRVSQATMNDELWFDSTEKSERAFKAKGNCMLLV